MSILHAELRKVWGNKSFPFLLLVLAALNLLLLWCGTRPTYNQPSTTAYKEVAQELSGMSMEEKGEYLAAKYTEIQSILKIYQYYQEVAYGLPGMEQYRKENQELFDTYEQSYREKTYRLLTDSLNTEFKLFNQLVNEYETVAKYEDFLESVQTKASQLAGISIFQKDKTGYDLKNIELTAEVYAGLQNIPIDYSPQKGLYTAISYPFTDMILLAAMLLLALLLVRQERDSGLLSYIRSLPRGRLQTAFAKLLAFAVSLLAILVTLFGVNLLYCEMTFGLGPLNRSIQSVPALMRCTMQITVWQYLFYFLLAKWAGAFIIGSWVMLAALLAKRAITGWIGALILPLLMWGIREVIPATSHWNVLKYANLFSLLKTNELLGNYRNLYWFGSPIGLPLVECLTAIFCGTLLFSVFCAVFTYWQLLSASKFSVVIPCKTKATSVFREEGRKLLLINGAAIFVAAFIGFGIYQGITAESCISADEIYYAYYMKNLSGPYTKEKYLWLKEAAEEFKPMLEIQQQVARGSLGREALEPFYALQMKFNAFQTVVSKINNDLKNTPGIWLVYESGYRTLFDFSGHNDLQDTLYAGLLCALCFSGLFAMERKGGMDRVIQRTPMGRKHTVWAKLIPGSGVAIFIAVATCLPHIWQILRDYGLPALLAPAKSISEFAALPLFVTLQDMLVFWFVCRLIACCLMGAICLWLGHKTGSFILTLFISATSCCLPCLLALSGMKNGIEYLGSYCFFHAIDLFTVQRYTAAGVPCSYGWLVFLSIGLALLYLFIIYDDLINEYDKIVF